MSNEIDKKKATEYLAEYWRTYSDQTRYEDYRDNTFIHDALYGIGVAIDSEKYSNANGYWEFKKFLKEFLSDN